MAEAGIAVPTLADFEALAARVRRLELAAQHGAPSGWIRIADFPGGARRARRLAKAGRLRLHRVEGGGRLLYVRTEDIDALMVAVEVTEPEAEPIGDAAPCDDGAEWAARNLRLLVGGSK